MSEGAARVLLVSRSGGLCEAHLDGCTRHATDAHHRRKPGRLWHPANLLHLCRACHQWTEDHPDEARQLGLWVDGHVPANRVAEVPVWLEPHALWRAQWLLDDEANYALAG